MPEQVLSPEQRSSTDVTESADAPAPRPMAAEVHPSGLAIIGSKIGPAAPARSILARPRLVDWFSQHAQSRVMLVSGEAGYGKTTLLGEFAMQTRDRCAWYRLERSDGNWITFLSYMVATLRDVWPGFGRATEALLRNVASMGSTREVALAQFLADLSSAESRRVAVILDDYHLVETSPDVRMIVSRMFERAPEGMYFILSGRGDPNLSLGRLRAQGRLHGLTVDDLRFSLPEIEHLFANTYGQPLDIDACRIIAERTEGWPAGLHLVGASVAAARPSEVADFINALSGATGPIYDFLAEEVLTRLSPETQQVLIHASLVERVRPEYVSVAMDAAGIPADHETIGHALDKAETLGLLGARSKASQGKRLQGLFRDFLQVHLERDASPSQIGDMHLAIAKVAEADDWLLAAHHYGQGGEPADAMRVLGSAASEALGTGAWGAAVEVIDSMPSTSPPTAVKVIQARAHISDQHPELASALLADVDRSTLSPEERGLVGLTLATIHHVNGDGERLRSEIEAIERNSSVPAVLRDIASTWRLILVTAAGGCITDVAGALRRMAAEQSKLGLHYFAGITQHNAATAELARGNYRQAIDLAQEATSHLAQTDESSSINSSTQSVVAAATSECGDLEEGLRLANEAATDPDATADAIAEAAYLHAVCGRSRQAKILLARLDRGDARWSRDPSTQALGCYARFALSMNDGTLVDARDSLVTLQKLAPVDFDVRTRTAVLVAVLAVAEGLPVAPTRVREAAELVQSQNAWRWMMRVRILEAVIERDGESLALWITEAENDSSLSVLELADVIATAIGTLAPLPEALERSILREPARWIAALGRQVRREPSESAGAAASLIARYGTSEDASLLREFERSPGGKPKKRGLATQLVRRVSPTVRVHDLGLASYEVGDRIVSLSAARRKSAALLLYFVTKSDLAANREQVMEALWPDQTPKSALNSLHQTIFVLRRELEPWYEDGATADYVHMDTDLVRLDKELFQVDSIAFARQATDIIGAEAAAERGSEMLALYRGHFAPEFEYEEWAEEWRIHLQTTYLHLAHATSMSLVGEHRYGEVVEALTPVVALEPTAFDLRGTLVGCLAAAGARDAALAHYRSLAAAHERDLGLPAPSFSDLIRAVSAMP